MVQGENKMIEVVTEDGESHCFYGDELTSPEQEAVMFLQEQDQDKREF